MRNETVGNREGREGVRRAGKGKGGIGRVTERWEGDGRNGKGREGRGRKGKGRQRKGERW